MPVEVKICGLSTEETMLAALDAGADYVGLVFFAKSPRHVSLETAANLAALARDRAKVVALMVDPGDAEIAALLREVRPDLLQLHGDENVDRVHDIRETFGIPVMKAIKVANEADARASRAYRGEADLILFDARPDNERAALPGGNGVPFDWSALEAVAGDGPFMLSGGLTPANVAAAIRVSGAVRVDVSSGVERAPGEKDQALIRTFIASAKAAAPKT